MAILAYLKHHEGIEKQNERLKEKLDIPIRSERLRLLEHRCGLHHFSLSFLFTYPRAESGHAGHADDSVPPETETRQKRAIAMAISQVPALVRVFRRFGVPGL